MANIAGLPTSSNPYKGSSRGSSQMPEPMPTGGLKPPTDMGGTPGPQGMAEQSQQLVWEPYKLNDKRDMVFRRTDGFYLRARPFESVSNKWVAQLFRDGKVIDKGQVFMPENVDPAKFLQKIANYLLDDDSFRYQQAGMPEPVSEDQTQGPSFDLDSQTDFDIELQ